jgi:hypothetical protein
LYLKSVPISFSRVLLCFAADGELAPCPNSGH